MRPRSRRKLTDEQQRRLTVVSGNLASLSQHPAWPDLLQAIADHEKIMHKITLTEIYGGVKPVNQRDVDFRRGFLKGMHYMVSVCEGAEVRIEALLKEAAAAAEGSSTT